MLIHTAKSNIVRLMSVNVSDDDRAKDERLISILSHHTEYILVILTFRYSFLGYTFGHIASMNILDYHKG